MSATAGRIRCAITKMERADAELSVVRLRSTDPEWRRFAEEVSAVTARLVALGQRLDMLTTMSALRTEADHAD